MKKTRIVNILTLLICLLAALSSPAQQEKESDRVSVKLYLSQDKVHQKSDLLFALEVHVMGGWHINSDAPFDEFLVPSSIALIADDPFHLAKVQYPDPIQLTLPFSEVPVSVFEGIVHIGGILEIPEELELGEYDVSLEFNYKACDDISCEAPRTVRLGFSIPIVDKDIPIEKINSEIFSKMNLRK